VPAEPEFTVAQANSLLPGLTRLLRSLISELRVAGDPKSSEHLGQLAGHNGGGPLAAELLAAGGRAERHARFLLERGMLLRDLDTGLLDFPAVRDGEPVFLCWRLGEPEVGWWHPRDQGFSSRRPL
jgi:hypothetical protein